MKLVDLIDQVGDDDGVIFQVNHYYDDWDEYDTLSASSPLLKPFYENTISSLSAISGDIFRFQLGGRNE